MSRKTIFALMGVLALVLVGPSAFAHNLWLNPSGHFPRVGESVDIGIGWGHAYPASRTHQEVKEDTVEEITALDPDGQTVSLESVSASLYRLKVEKAGVYLVTARIKPGVFTMTPEGRKWANKKEVQNPTKCTAFQISAKTALVVGESDRNLNALTGQPLELVPLANPSKLAKGASLPVRMLFEGKPLVGAPVKATYAGYGEAGSGEAEARKPAEKREGMEAGKQEGTQGKSDEGHRGGGMVYPVETTTDEKGEAIIPVSTGGFWMVSLSHRPPYPDSETCDEYMYNYAFTFQVK